MFHMWSVAIFNSEPAKRAVLPWCSWPYIIPLSRHSCSVMISSNLEFQQLINSDPTNSLLFSECRFVNCNIVLAKYCDWCWWGGCLFLYPLKWKHCLSLAQACRVQIAKLHCSVIFGSQKQTMPTCSVGWKVGCVPIWTQNSLVTPAN